MLLNKKLIHYNYSPRRDRIKYIVIHDTGNTAPTANALNHYRYFAGGNRRASAHYFIDQDGVVQVIEDAHAAWHCGDGRGRHGITNANSIGIELCINQGNNMEKTKTHATKLIRELMSHYHLPKSHVVRHYDASRKNCPATMRGQNWEPWWGFWEQI